MKMRYFSLLLCALISSSLAALEKGRADKIWVMKNPLSMHIKKLEANNPSMRYYMPHATATVVELKGDRYKEHQPILSQQGDRYRNFSLQAESLIELNPHTIVWGEASYNNQLVKGMRFNNTSDLNLVYPYTLADTLGGELQSEIYQFSGGYLHRFNSPYTVGVELSYRALMAHRDKDPRPKNTVSDLNFRIGVNRTMGSNYHIGLGLLLQKYKQDNNIKLFSNIEKIPIYHLTGLGMRNRRFDAVFTNAQFDGKGYGATLSLNTNQSNGWLGEMSYRVFQYDKLMTDLNDIPLNHLKEQKVHLLAGYQHKNWAASLESKLSKRRGTEIIYGSPSSGHYPELDRNRAYKHQKQEYRLNLIWKWSSQKTAWFLAPTLSYSSSKESYNDPNRHYKYSAIGTGITSSLRWKSQMRGTLTLTSQVGYRAKFNSSALMTDQKEDDVLLALTQEQSLLLQKNEGTSGVSLRWDLPFRLLNQTETFVCAAWSGCFIQSYKPAHYTALTLGFIF